jgi:cytidylate kinase
VESRVGHYVREWEKRQSVHQKTDGTASAPSEITPCIAFSRKIGVGTLEIADMVATSLGCQVADRELVEGIAKEANTTTKAIDYFDERFPGYVNRTFKYLFGEKAFIDSDYARHLIGTVTAIAGLERTVFVGRGAHLILPRDRVLAVRCICSDGYRIARIAKIAGISLSEAKKQLATHDKEQAAFFKKVYNQKTASPYEFDMVLNLDHFAKPEGVADIVVSAFEKKFEGLW